MSSPVQLQQQKCSFCGSSFLIYSCFDLQDGLRISSIVFMLSSSGEHLSDEKQKTCMCTNFVSRIMLFFIFLGAVAMENAHIKHEQSLK